MENEGQCDINTVVENVKVEYARPYNKLCLNLCFNLVSC